MDAQLTTVLVTGATGYIAGHIVKELLERGNYHVRATVRDPANTSRLSHLTALDGAADRLEFVGADLLTQGSFDDHVQVSVA